jgi:hypothetical protein
MKNSKDAVKGNDSVALEFPDWTGMDDSTRRVSPETAFRLCEQYMEWFPELASQAKSQRPEKCIVEFVL